MTTSAIGESPREKKAKPVATDLALLLMVVIWAVNFSVAKLALNVLSPLAFNALRFPLAAIVVLVALRVRGPIPLPLPGDRLRLVALGLLGNLLYQQFFIFGLDQTRAGTASLLLAGTPMLTALLSAAVGHERVGWQSWLGAGATIAGIALIVGSAAGESGSMIKGDLLMILASVAWAGYTVGSRPLVEHYGAIAVTAWTLCIGAIGVVLVGLPDLARTQLTALPLGAWLSVVYAGAMSIGVAYLIWYHGVRQIGNTRTAVYSNLVPVVALAVAWAWLDETPALHQVLGALIIIGGVTLAQARRDVARSTYEGVVRS
jgi:drug/metabolite transporter (DMT)-like permease